MKTVIQRVKDASVTVDGSVVGSIDKGLLIYYGVEKGDSAELIAPLANKIANLRIFTDENGKMNLNIKDVGGGILVVSQFTLCANLKSGNRPGWDKAELPEIAEKYYLQFIDCFRALGFRTEHGTFGAHMHVRYENDGPVTILIEKSIHSKE